MAGNRGAPETENGRLLGVPRGPRLLLGGVGLLAVVGGTIAVFRGVGDAAAAVLITVGFGFLALALLVPYVQTFKGGGLEIELRDWSKLTRTFQTAEQIDRATIPPTSTSRLDPSGTGLEGSPAMASADRGEPNRSIDFSPDVLDELLLAVHFGQRGIFVGHAVKPVADVARTTWEFAVFLTGWGPLDAVEKAEFYMGPAWRRRIFTATPDSQGQVGVVVKAFNGFLVLCRVTLSDGTRVLLNHYCNLSPGDSIEDDRFRDALRHRSER